MDDLKRKIIKDNQTAISIIVSCYLIVTTTYIIFLEFNNETFRSELIEKYNSLEDQCVLYNYNYTKSVAKGIAYSDKFYCVWTEGKDIHDIADTNMHELCHILIEKDKEAHFCKEK